MTARATTHAGAVCVRVSASGREYLLVGPRSGGSEWVLPKGHQEPGESLPATALRELAEEAGVQGATLRELGLSVFEASAGKTVQIAYFLVVFVAAVAAKEERRTGWFSYDAAHSQLTHADARQQLEIAEAVARNILRESAGVDVTTALHKQLEFLNERMKETSDTANQFLNRYLFGGLVAVVGVLNIDLVMLKEPLNLQDSNNLLLLAGIGLVVLVLSRVYFRLVLQHYHSLRVSHRKLKYKYELTLHSLLLGTSATDYGRQLEEDVEDPPPKDFADTYPSVPREVPNYLLDHHRKALADLKPEHRLVNVALLMVFLTMAVRFGGLLLTSAGAAH